MSHRVALIIGGSIGTEVIPPVLDVLRATGVDIEWSRVDIPAARPDDDIQDLIQPAVEAVQDCGIGFKTRLIGPPPHELVSDNNSPGPSNPNVLFRKALGLFAGVRPIRTLDGLATRYPDLDLLLIRENTEDIYKGIEHEIVPGVVQSLKVVTREASERIARYAFEIAEEYDRRKVTFIHKGNIMKQSDGLFMRVVREVAEDHSEVEYDEQIVDAACMKMVLDPYQFDLLLTGNLYGDILSSLATGLAGGISVGLSIGIGDGDLRVFEAIHGDAPHLVGTGRANPLPAVAPAIELLRHLGEAETAERLRSAVESVLRTGETLTPDLGGDATTREMCDALIRALS